MSVGCTHTGNWYVQYRVPGLVSPRKEYFGKGEAGMNYAAKRADEIQSGHVFTIASLKGRTLYLDELAQVYLDFLKSQGKNESWRKSIASLVNNHFLPVLSYCPVDQLSFQDVMLVANRFSLKSIATRNRYLECLRTIFNFGINQGLTTNNPMRTWKKAREPKREFKLTFDDLQCILDKAQQHLKWALEVLWELGTRPGNSELFRIKWEDIDYERDVVHIRGTKTQSSDRLIPLTEYFKSRLLERQELAKSEYVIEYNGHKVTNVKRSFQSALKEAGISYPVRLYDVRHLFASTMLANGADLKAVSKLLGHSTTRMTADVYYHELKGEKKRALLCKARLL